MNVLVIGGTGLVGSNLVTECRRRGHATHGTYRTTTETLLNHCLDKTEEEATRNLICDLEPDVVIDTAAFHAVDDCEENRELAWEVNATGTKNAATAANDVGAHFIYLSTDYVFPGRPGETPYTEDDPVAPLNYYARTKYAGEQAARIADQYTVLRPSVIYGLTSENFLTWAHAELEASNEISIVDDQTSRPTYAPDLANGCLDIAETGLTGLYHSTGPESMSRYEFTYTLADSFGFNPALIEPITTAELGQDAPRPADSSLDSTQIYQYIDTSFIPPATAFDRMVE